MRNAGSIYRSRFTYAIAGLAVIVVFYMLKMSGSASPSSKDEIRDLSEKLQTITTKYNELLLAKSNEASPTHSADGSKAFLDALVASESDKYYRHHYENYYIHWLEPFRHVPNLKLLEIGADKGRSLLLWSNYFSDPHLILGLAYGEDAKDIDQTVSVNQQSGKMREIVQVVKGDQSKKETMEKLRTMGPYHIIVDDGSHVPDHMAFSLFSLWNSVEPGGLYVLEDLECNYWANGSNIYGYTLRGTGVGTSPKDNVVEKIKQLIDTLVKNQIGATKEDMSIMPGDENICSIEFGKNLVVLKKCSEAELANAPPLLPQVYDADHMAAWVKDAISSNPAGF
jgi:Methyltransferase domain